MRRNAVLLFLARLTSAGTTVVVLSLVSNLRGAEALGQVGIGFATGAIGAVVSDLGIASLLVREVARRPESAGQYLGAGLALRVVTLPVTLLGAWAIAALIAPASAGVVVLAAAGLIGQQAADLTRAVFVANQRMVVSSAHAIVENVLWLAVVAVGLAGGASLEATFLAALAVWLGSVVAGVVLARALLGVTPARPRRAQLSEMLRLATPFAGFAIVGIGYSRIDPLLIGLLATGPALAIAGAYFAASRLVAAFEYLPDALSRAIYPELSRRVVDEPARVLPLLGSAAAVLLAVGAAVPAVLIPGGTWLMGVLFGPEAGRDGWVLGALSLAVPIRYLGYLYGMTLTSADAQARRVLAAGGALVFVVAIDVVGIPAFGVAAAVVATIGGASIVSALYATFVRRRFGGVGVGVTAVAATAIAAVAGVVVGLAAQRFVPDVVAAAAAGLVYVAVIAVGPTAGALRGVMRRAPAA
jgi:O-antigen/teichoic acid export membrane protein